VISAPLQQRSAGHLDLYREQQRRSQRADAVVRGEDEETIQRQQRGRAAFTRADVSAEAEETIER
jgi:hypothetical protein